MGAPLHSKHTEIISTSKKNSKRKRATDIDVNSFSVELLSGAKSLLGSATSKTHGDDMPLAWQQSLATLWMFINDRLQSKQKRQATPSAEAAKLQPAIVASSVVEGLEYINGRLDDAHVLVTGSFFLVADVLDHINHDV